MNKSTPLVFLLVIAFSASAAAADRVIKDTLPAAGVHEIKLSAKVGKVRIAPSDDNSVHIAVTLKPKTNGFWFVQWSSGEKVVAKATLRHSLNDGVLSLSLGSVDADSSDFEEQWEVTLPATTAIDGDLDIGKADVDGMSGGVKFDVNVGDLNVAVPHGSVHATINVGKISVATAETDYKTLDAEASVGDIAINGLSQVPSKTSRSGPAQSLHLTGRGNDDFVLKSDVGHVTLTFGAKP